MRHLLKILAISSLAQVSYAQEYCFENNGLKNTATISFELKGDIVKFGVWEHGNDQTNNAECYLFYGKKTGDKLLITFTRTIPYTMPNQAKEAIWILEKGALKIPMYEKNYNTNNFENTVAIFPKCKPTEDEDEHEITKKSSIPCSCEAYVIDPDKGGLNVRENGDKNAKIVSKVPYNTDGTMVYLNSSNSLGWVSIGNIPYINEKPIKKEGFVFAQKLGISSSGYEYGSVSLFSKPDTKSSVLLKIPSEKNLVILDCNESWLKVKYKTKIGWLSFNDRCANPVTTCN